jgi:hypothetical protein
VVDDDDGQPIIRCCWCGDDIRVDVGDAPCRKIHDDWQVAQIDGSSGMGSKESG